MGLASVLLQGAFGGSGGAAGSPPLASAVRDDLLETTKGLQVTQQQAVDQLQVVQDQLIAQKAETKKLSEQIAAITEKLNGIQASTPTSN